MRVLGGVAYLRTITAGRSFGPTLNHQTRIRCQFVTSLMDATSGAFLWRKCYCIVPLYGTRTHCLHEQQTDNHKTDPCDDVGQPQNPHPCATARFSGIRVVDKRYGILVRALPDIQEYSHSHI